MIWFNGTVTGAVEKVKSSTSLLLVFIQGNDDLSKSYESFLDKEIKFNSHQLTAIKISEHSLAYEQFKNIYATVPVPSVFVIGPNGIPLGIICSQKPHDLHSVISEAIAKHQKENNEKLTSIKTPTTENLHSKDAGKNSSQGYDSAKNDIDYESSRFISENVKLKFENSSLNPRFFLYEMNHCVKNCFSQNIQSARIQFRLPSNEIRSWEFPNMCTLHDVKLYLMETMKLSSSFKLLRTYPRTAFSPQDEDKTLADLSLTPNATLIVVLLQDEAIQAKIKKMVMKKNLVVTFIITIFQPLFTFIGYCKKRIFGNQEPKKISKNAASVKRSYVKNSRNNIHGFEFDNGSDSDSEMNTDNGNSTQQK